MGKHGPMYYDACMWSMLTPHLTALKDSVRTLLLIGGCATVGAGILTLIIGLDTPYAPWDRESNTMFPPVLFTLASFVATVAFCACTTVFHSALKLVTNNPDNWWRVSGVLFLLSYGTFSFMSQTVEAAIMLNILHLIVGIPALVFLPQATRIE